MTGSRSWLAATLTVAFLLLGTGSGLALAQDPGKDDDLGKLLDKLEKDKPKDADKPATSDKPKDEAKPAAEPKPAAESKPADKAKPKGDVAPADAGLDKLLEGLGETREKPAEDDPKSGSAGPPPSDPRGGADAKPGQLKEQDKDLGQHLDEMVGKGEKKKKQKGDGDGESSGPMGSIIKEMREVEKRLGEPDTGEETRKRQTEIVKNLDGLIEQLKNAPGGAQGMKMIRQGKKPGQQPGQENQQGAMANGPPPTKPLNPKDPAIPIEIVKNVWGQLPPQLRDDMSNIFNEHPLPTKTDLIRLYYLSLGQKSNSREP